MEFVVSKSFCNVTSMLLSNFGLSGRLLTDDFLLVMSSLLYSWNVGNNLTHRIIITLVTYFGFSFMYYLPSLLPPQNK